MPINVTADPIDVTAEIPQTILSHYPAAPRDTTLDTTFDCLSTSPTGIEEQGVIYVTLELTGTWLSITITASPITVTTSLAGTWRAALVIAASPIVVTTGFGSTVGVLLTGPTWQSSGPRSSFVQWSDIGNLDFTIGRGNVAGEKPLDWKGTVYSLKQLGDQVIVAYGSGGISELIASGVHYGTRSVPSTGIKSKLAVVAAGKNVHYYVDTGNNLYRYSANGPELLGYSEYLSELSSPVLSWDSVNRLLYICDGAKGFVYSPEMQSLGRGPVNVSGFGYRQGVSHIVSPATITNPVFEVVTDTYDLGHRNAKTIKSVEVGLNATVQIDARIEYRHNKASNFLVTSWYPVDSRGVCHIHCYGYEFRFHFRAASAEWFRLDHVRINGLVHDH